MRGGGRLKQSETKPNETKTREKNIYVKQETRNEKREMRIGRTSPPQATKQRSLIKQKVWQINTQQAAETLCFTHHTHTWNGVLLLRLATTKHRIHSYCKDSLSKTILVLRKGGAFPAWGVLSFMYVRLLVFICWVCVCGLFLIVIVNLPSAVLQFELKYLQ